MPTVGFIDCPHCVEWYIIPSWPPFPKLPPLARVFVKCSGCGHVLEFRAGEIDVAHHSLGGKPHAAIIRIEPTCPTLGMAHLTKANFQISSVGRDSEEATLVNFRIP
jgi:hypothetical protein